MRSTELGLVLPMEEAWTDGSTPRWVEIRELALRAEAMGFDTVWVPDELLWRREETGTHGWWECVAMTGAVAAATSRIKVGTWILSALHRNPAITAKAVETFDEISGGRYVFGLGSGHAGSQAHAFGLPEDHVVGRFEEAIEIIVPLLRNGRADFEGTFHAARDLEHRPVGPRPGGIPIMIGASGPKDASPGCPARRRLELVRGGAERVRRVRAAAGGARSGLPRGRPRSRLDRSVRGDPRRADRRDRGRGGAGRSHPWLG